jgi:hypothetical protein
VTGIFKGGNCVFVMENVIFPGYLLKAKHLQAEYTSNLKPPHHLRLSELISISERNAHSNPKNE